MKKIAIGLMFIFLSAVLMQAFLWTQKGERLFREAKILIFDEEWEEALEILEELLADYPKSEFFAQFLLNKATCLKELEGNEVEALLRIDPEIVKDLEEEVPSKYNVRVLKFSVHRIGKKQPEFFISIPWSLADLIFSIIPEQSRISMRKQGFDIDHIISDLTKLKGEILEIRDDEEGIVIKIWIE